VKSNNYEAPSVGMWAYITVHITECFTDASTTRPVGGVEIAQGSLLPYRSTFLGLFS
jgi:hypothetical protein